MKSVYRFGGMPLKCALQGVSSDQVLQMPMMGRPSKA